MSGPTDDLRAAIVEAVRSHPGVFSRRRLALYLQVRKIDVNDAVRQLIDEDVLREIVGRIGLYLVSDTKDQPGLSRGRGTAGSHPARGQDHPTDAQDHPAVGGEGRTTEP